MDIDRGRDVDVDMASYRDMDGIRYRERGVDRDMDMDRIGAAIWIGVVTGTMDGMIDDRGTDSDRDMDASL